MNRVVKTFQKDFAERDETFSGVDMVPAKGYTADDVEQDVTALMRVRRKLRPGEENDFAVIPQAAIQAFLDKILGPIGLALFVIASIAIMVGGIGVMAIMLVSVTERTREIGVRKSLGARSVDILWQFLFEAAALTSVGGLIGVAGGLGIAQVATAAFGLPATVPVLWTLAAVLFSVGIGIVFGLFPAWQAASLDPIEAMRNE